MLNSYFKFKYITLYFFQKKKKKITSYFLTKSAACALHMQPKQKVWAGIHVVKYNT